MLSSHALFRRPLRLGLRSITPFLSRLYVVGRAPPSLTPGEKQIYDKLLDALEPSALTVQDVSGASSCTWPKLCALMIAQADVVISTMSPFQAKRSAGCL